MGNIGGNYMLIKEVDFKNISQYKNTNVIPVFMQYCEECYEIAINEKQSENAWSIFQKIVVKNC